MKTYVNERNFQFITDFSKYYMTIEGKEVEIDFGTLTIPERVILSAYLTLKCMGKNYDDHENYYDIIFNFNNSKNNKTSYYETFISDLTNMDFKNIYFKPFINEYYNKIENDKTVIYRSQLNASEMNLLYSLKFQRNYYSLMNVLYIIGIAKQNITTSKLNKIELNKFYPTSKSLSIKRVEEIFKKINSVSNKKVNYKIVDDFVYFRKWLCC